MGFHGHSNTVHAFPKSKRKTTASRIFESVRDEVIAAGGVQEWSNFMIQEVLSFSDTYNGRKFMIEFTDSTHADLTT